MSVHATVHPIHNDLVVLTLTADRVEEPEDVMDSLLHAAEASTTVGIVCCGDLLCHLKENGYLRAVPPSVSVYTSNHTIGRALHVKSFTRVVGSMPNEPLRRVRASDTDMDYGSIADRIADTFDVLYVVFDSVFGPSFSSRKRFQQHLDKLKQKAKTLVCVATEEFQQQFPMLFTRYYVHSTVPSFPSFVETVSEIATVVSVRPGHNTGTNDAMAETFYGLPDTRRAPFLNFEYDFHCEILSACSTSPTESLLTRISRNKLVANIQAGTAASIMVALHNHEKAPWKGPTLSPLLEPQGWRLNDEVVWGSMHDMSKAAYPHPPRILPHDFQLLSEHYHALETSQDWATHARLVSFFYSQQARIQCIMGSRREATDRDAHTIEALYRSALEHCHREPFRAAAPTTIFSPLQRLTSSP